jgi:hypothetical protein
MVRLYDPHYEGFKKSSRLLYFTLGVFLTFFIILVAICFAGDRIRLVNPKFVLSVATVMMVLATVVGLHNPPIQCVINSKQYVAAPYNRLCARYGGVHNWRDDKTAKPDPLLC